VFFEEFTPFIVQQRAIGLHRIEDLHTRLAVLLNVRDGASKEFDTHQRGLAALPGNVYLGDLLSFNILRI
jgi:hypothetical protein